MTTTQQNLGHKKIELDFYYKLAEEAAQAYDIEQALKISQNGLKIAQAQNKAEWIEKFVIFNSYLHHDLLEQNNPSPSIIKEDFTVIKGVGPAVVKKLNEKKIKSIEMLANITPKTLATMITGIGVATAQKIVNAARNYLSLNVLNDFSQLEEECKNQQIHKEIDEKFNSQDLERLTDEKLSKIKYQKLTNKDYVYTKHKFWLIIRNLGFFLLLYSLLLIFIVIFQQYSILTILINLGFALIGFISIIIGYVYFKFHLTKISLQNNSAVPSS
ncbi:MAG: helix-hairpin-helix domain-containing protein [Candidatus Odinarchaeota archaeon]